jgi:phosphoribosylamine--glycine ligase
MGSISPVPFVDEAFMQKVEERIIRPTIEGLQSDGISYKGFIFFGLMNVGGNPYVIEYNARMGDPEAESIMPRIQSDLLELFIDVGNETLQGKRVTIDPRYSTAVMAVSGGYPEAYEKGKPISGLENVTDAIVFHAGTKTGEKPGSTITNGGRVIAITGMDKTLSGALEKSYKNLEKISFDKIYYRKDLGQDLKEYI